MKAIFTITKAELPLALSMFSYFFLVITSFWILKPIKKGLFIQYYDQSGFDLFAWHMSAAQAELLAKALNMVVAGAAVIVFTWLVRRFRRQQLTYIFTGFFLLSYIVYSTIISNPGDLTIWSFYLFGDLFSTLMVATFFAFLNDSVTPDAAKRLYGLVGLGGVTGGVFGTTAMRSLIATIDPAGWLWICVGLGVLILLVAAVAGRLVATTQPPTAARQEAAAPAPGNPALEGARLVSRSPYLLSIVGIVGLYEIVSTVLDFQFTSTIAYYLDGAAIGRQFSTVFLLTNIVSMVVQLFLTSMVMTRFGVGVALLVLPLAILLGSTGFMVVPILWIGSLLNTLDNGFSYSINQSAKEALYVPTSTDEKYKAKAFIDMFVQRFAKALAVAVSLGLTAVFSDFASLRWLSVFTIG
ncbi:MAG: Npt1/Npt2 family nucleotide transporter, partial [Candidatus Tectomicrobia bacterium]